MVFLSLTKLIYGQLVISVIWSYCLYGHFSLDEIVDHISNTHYICYKDFANPASASVRPCSHLLRNLSTEYMVETVHN